MELNVGGTMHEKIEDGIAKGKVIEMKVLSATGG